MVGEFLQAAFSWIAIGLFMAISGLLLSKKQQELFWSCLIGSLL